MPLLLLLLALASSPDFLMGLSHLVAKFSFDCDDDYGQMISHLVVFFCLANTFVPLTLLNGKDIY